MSDADLETVETPRARVSILTIALIVCNWLAAVAFLYLLLMDYKVRQDWSYAVFRNYLGIYGLPLQSEEQYPGYHESLPRLRLDPEQLKEAYAARGGRGVSFVAVEEPVRFRVLPSHITEEVKKELFQGLGDEVGTLEEEAVRLKRTLPEKMVDRAKEVAAGFKTDDEKRKAIESVLLPLAWDTYQLEALQKQIKEAQPAALEGMLVDALQRRMYFELLAPLNLFRPGDTENLIVEKIADTKTYPVEKLRELFEKRCDAAVSATYDPDVHYGKIFQDAKSGKDADKRDSVEKRQKIAFLLLDVAHVRVPLEKDHDKSLLEPRGLERAQTVAGLYELALATQKYVETIRTLDDRIRDEIRADRMGYVVTGKDGTITRTNGFPDRYNTEVQRLKDVTEQIEHETGRLEDLKSQRDRFQKVQAEREAQLKATTAKLLTARKDTAEAVYELRNIQRQLFEAQRELADAADRNFDLERRIRESEARLRGGK